MPLPTTTELEAVLAAGGFSPAIGGALDLELALAAAVDQLEQELGVMPLIAAVAVSARDHDLPCDGWLRLDGGLVAAPTLVQWTGLTLLPGTGYEPRPRNALVKALPYTHLYFRSGYQVGNGPSASGTLDLWPKVTVTGRWGYWPDASAVPALAQQGLLARASLTLMPSLMAARINAAAVPLTDSEQISRIENAVDSFSESDMYGAISESGGQLAKQAASSYAIQGRQGWVSLLERVWEQTVAAYRLSSPQQTTRVGSPRCAAGYR